MNLRGSRTWGAVCCHLPQPVLLHVPLDMTRTAHPGTPRTGRAYSRTQKPLARQGSQSR